MNKVLLLLVFAVSIGSASAENAAAPTPSPTSLLSFSLTPNFAPNSGRKGLGISAGATISCQYRLPASPLYAGADLGYSIVGLTGRRGGMSMFQAGLSAGLHLDILPTLGMRGFGSAGYSYNFVQPSFADDFFYSLFHPFDNTAGGGTPFVSAGAELSWTFIPSLSLTAGAKYRYFLDLYADTAVTLGISYNLRVGGPKTAKPPMQRAVPLKKATYPRSQARPQGAITSRLSQFLSPEEPTLLMLSHQINSLVGANTNRAIDKNLQCAIGFHEAFCLLDLAYVSTPMESAVAVHSVKSPLQTLQEGSGDSSGLSVLYCSLFKAVQMATAFITTPGHVFVALALASSEEEARKTFSRTDEFIFRDGKVWVPIEVTERKGSFLTAWQAGAKEWHKARKKAHFYPVGALRNAQEPVGASRGGDELPLADQSQLVDNFQQEIARLVAWEINDQEAGLLAEVSKSNGSPNTLNALGVLYARWDLLEKAEAQFKAALQTNEYAPALVNLGNLRLLANSAEEALGFYQRAAAVAPHDPAVLLGLARSNYELRNYGLVEEEFDELQTQSPQLAEQFSYLRLHGEEATEAAQANREKGGEK